METERKTLVTFSWDDGHPLDLRMAQLFAKHGVSCTFYVPKLNSENLPTLNSSDLKNLSGDNFDIHSHTLNHVYLKGLPLTKQMSEIQSGKIYIEDTIGKEDHLFCYPGGRLTQKTIELVKEAGFTYARTIDMGFSYAYSSNNYLMPTTAIIAPLTSFQIFKHSLKRNALTKWYDTFNFNRMILNQTWHHEKSKNSYYHFWGHSWEIEKYNLWQCVESLVEGLIASDAKIVSNKEFYEQKPVFT